MSEPHASNITLAEALERGYALLTKLGEYSVREGFLSKPDGKFTPQNLSLSDAIMSGVADETVFGARLRKVLHRKLLRSLGKGKTWGPCLSQSATNPIADRNK
jgi:hypothetical protein